MLQNATGMAENDAHVNMAASQSIYYFDQDSSHIGLCLQMLLMMRVDA